MSQSISQLTNLKRGGVPGRKKKAPIKISEKTAQLLEKNLIAFTEKMDTLTPKEYVAAYLQLMKLILPKQLNIQTGDTPLPVFTIVASEANDTTGTEPTTTLL